ncbi:MAG: DUF4037 domain-containing protein, partial [Actinoplanes sp.]
DRPHAAARLGPGSDVLGFDTPRSTDHDWGPRLELFVDDPGDLSEVLARRLPTAFRGWSTHFAPHRRHDRSMTPTDGPVDHYITIAPFESWVRDLLGFPPDAPLTCLDWLATPWQRFAELTGGAVFHDPTGALATLRDRLTWYPDDVWRYVLAAQWQRIAQEEAFPGRAAEAGDELGARVVTARLCREVGRLTLLLGRRWPPYQKWLMHALGPDPVVAPLLAALRASDAADRQDALCTALELTAERQNDTGLSVTLPATRRQFHTRPYAVLGAERFAEGLRAAISEPALRERPLTGCVDQITDNTDALGSRVLDKFYCR